MSAPSTVARKCAPSISGSGRQLAEPLEVDAARRGDAGEDQHRAEDERQGRQRLRREAAAGAQRRRRRAALRQPAPLDQREPDGGDAEREHLVDQPVEREGREDLRRRRRPAERGQQHRLEDAEPGRHMAEDAEHQRHAKSGRKAR